MKNHGSGAGRNGGDPIILRRRSPMLPITLKLIGLARCFGSTPEEGAKTLSLFKSFSTVHKLIRFGKVIH